MIAKQIKIYKFASMNFFSNSILYYITLTSYVRHVNLNLQLKFRFKHHNRHTVPSLLILLPFNVVNNRSICELSIYNII